MRSVGSDATESDLDRSSFELARVPGAACRLLELRAAGTWSEGADGEHDVPLSAAQWSLLERAAPLLPRREVVQCIEERLAAFDGPGRVSALELLRWHATANEVRLLFVLVAEETEWTGAPRDLPDHGPRYRAFLDALVAVVREDPNAVRAVDMRRDPLALRRAMLRAVGASRDERGLEWMVGRLADPDLAPVALQEMARIAPWAEREAVAPAARRIRAFLDAPESSSRRHAMRALASLRDAGAVPRLIGLLESPVSGERQCALSALQEVSGLRLPAEPDVWRTWHREEARWLTEDAAESLDRLDSDRDSEVVAAVREISEHGLYRDELSAPLSQVLARAASPSVQREVCLALGRLRSRVAIAELLPALDDSDEVVRGAACAALTAITGIVLPPSRAAWEAALPGRE